MNGLKWVTGLSGIVVVLLSLLEQSDCAKEVSDFKVHASYVPLPPKRSNGPSSASGRHDPEFWLRSRRSGGAMNPSDPEFWLRARKDGGSAGPGQSDPDFWLRSRKSQDPDFWLRSRKSEDPDFWLRSRKSEDPDFWLRSRKSEDPDFWLRSRKSEDPDFWLRSRKGDRTVALMTSDPEFWLRSRKSGNNEMDPEFWLRSRKASNDPEFWLRSRRSAPQGSQDSQKEDGTDSTWLRSRKDDFWLRSRKSGVNPAHHRPVNYGSEYDNEFWALAVSPAGREKQQGRVRKPWLQRQRQQQGGHKADDGPIIVDPLEIIRGARQG